MHYLLLVPVAAAGLTVNLAVVLSILWSLPRRPPTALVVFDLSLAAVCLTNCLSWPARALLWLDLVTLHTSVPSTAGDLATTCSIFTLIHTFVRVLNAYLPLFCIIWRFAIGMPNLISYYN